MVAPARPYNRLVNRNLVGLIGCGGIAALLVSLDVSNRSPVKPSLIVRLRGRCRGEKIRKLIFSRVLHSDSLPRRRGMASVSNFAASLRAASLSKHSVF